MMEDENTHILEVRQRWGLKTAITDWGEQKHTPSRNEETTGGLRTANTDGGGQKHIPTRDEETKEV